MLTRLFPQPADNTYRGYRLALWLFGLLLFMKVTIGTRSILDAHSVATSADGIPLDAFPAAAARTVIALFEALGVAHLTICAVGVLVLVRYRTLVPFMFALFLAQQLSRSLMIGSMPIPRAGSPPGAYVTLVMLTLMVVGLALSLAPRKVAPHGAPADVPA